MPLTKFRKSNKELKPWTIYVWEEGDLMRGAAQLLGTGFDEIYQTGKWIAEDEGLEKPTPAKNKWMAKSQVRVEMQNTLNALFWYGPRILDSKGNIDSERFVSAEMQASQNAAGLYIDISKTKPFKKYPVKNITFDKARELGLT